MQLILKTLSDEHFGRTIWLRAGQTATVGRTELADFAIADGAISSKHFELECDFDGCRIRDLDSHNGTFYNGQEVTAAVLCDGDTLVAGNTKFVVSIDDGFTRQRSIASNQN